MSEYLRLYIKIGHEKKTSVDIEIYLENNERLGHNNIFFRSEGEKITVIFSFYIYLYNYSLVNGFYKKCQLWKC